MRERDQIAGAATGPATAGLFIVERRLPPEISGRQMEVLQSALARAAGRFNGCSEGVHYLGSIFLTRSRRLLSLFWADSLETVRAVNEVSLIPFASIEPAIELSGPGRP